MQGYSRRWGWRKRVGIEPTVPGINLEPDGFEGRAGHQTRIASADSDSLDGVAPDEDGGAVDALDPQP